MLTIKVLVTAWNIGWFFIDLQIGYLLLPMTVILYGAPHKKAAK
jgi:hypothetical protein